jgi:hypothetical protein
MRHLPFLPALLLSCLALGCANHGGDEPDIRRYVEAVSQISHTARGAYASCHKIHDDALRADCDLAAVEAMAVEKNESVTELLGLCRAIPTDLLVDECAFQVAEKRKDAQACDQAGRFQADCRLHLLSASFASWIPRAATVNDPTLDARLEQEIVRVGLSAQDDRPWSAYYRWILGSHAPIDRGSCRAITVSEHRESCLQTGRALYDDRLNHARDTKTFPCDGSALPPDIQTGDDADLAGILEKRTATDLCR